MSQIVYKKTWKNNEKYVTLCIPLVYYFFTQVYV